MNGTHLKRIAFVTLQHLYTDI